MYHFLVLQSCMKLQNQDFINVTLSYVKEWLSSQDAYSLHKPTRKKFKKNKIIVHGISDQWKVDLDDMNNLAKFINGYRYIVTCIDILSKYAWAFPVKMNSAENVIKVFDKTFKLGRTPLKIQSDGGHEFNNASFWKYMKQSGIHYFTLRN